MNLKIGDTSENGQITIIDEDRLCYLVKSTSRGAYGLRTISKSLLLEYVAYFAKNPNASANDARAALRVNTQIDKFEYGYTSTLKTMAQMILGQVGTTCTSTVFVSSKSNLSPLQTIFYGAPGTGKSYKVKSEILAGVPEENIFRTTFHPDYDYASFVGCYKPTKLVDKIYTVSELHDLFVKESTTFPNRPEHRFAAKYSKSFAKLTNKEAEQVFEGVSTASTITAETPKLMASVEEYNKNGCNNAITYDFTPQSFTKAYIAAWKNYSTPITKTKTVVASPTMPASSATSPYTSASAGTPANTFYRKAVNGFDLTTGEEDLLKVVDAFLFPFVGVDCFGDIHKELNVFVDDKTTPDKHKVVYQREEVEAEFNSLKARLGEHPNDNLPEGQRFYFLKNLLFEMDRNKTNTLEKEYEFNIWGLYNSKENTVTIFKGQIYKDCYGDDSKRFALVATYIHEMFHAYFDKKINLPEIEEAIVECATLCFLEMMANVIGSPFNDIFTDYKRRVSNKKYSNGFSYYGFGAYLFEHRSLDWIKLFKDAVIDANSKAVKDYQAMFADTYTTDENKAMRLLYSILNPASAVSTTDGIDYGSKPVFLVIEEINRGNCAQIFGDIFQLLDRNESGYSEYPIDIDEDLKNYLVKELGADSEGIKNGKLCLPPNLNLLATMNTSDQSLFPMDSAFKRRWDWEYVSIKRADNEPENEWIIKVTHDGKTYWCYWWEFLEAINHQIEETTHSEDKQLGYFFAKPKAGENFISTDTFVNKVIFYLWNDVFKDEDSAVFQYDNEVDDVSINRAGTMYFRHFMENTDEMIHYFINQLFAMGKDNTPAVPIDYLKNDDDSKVIEYLPKMREGDPVKLDDEAVDEETSEGNGISVRKSDSIDNIVFSIPEYKKMSEKLTQALKGNVFKYSKNSMDMKMGDMPISYARLSMAYSSKKTDIKLYIRAKSVYNQSIECYNYLNSKGVEDIIAEVSERNNLEYELISKDIAENKVLGWRIKYPMTFSDSDDNMMDGDVTKIVEIVKELQKKITPIMNEFSKNGK